MAPEQEVMVVKGGRLVERVRRPVRDTADGPRVSYRGSLWPLINGVIDLTGSAVTPRPLPETSIPPQAAAAAHGRTPDPEQDRVTEAPVSDRILVVAGPGTGKTDVAARRLAQLIRSSTPPGRILVLSFSRSAVRNLTRRLQAMDVGDSMVIEELRHVSVRTFDSWAFRILRQAGHAPVDLLRRGHDENIALLASLLEGPGREALRPFTGERTHIIVDEFQDLPGVRGRMVLALLDLLAPPDAAGAGFTVLGDPAQAIYTFAARSGEDRGAVAVDCWEILRSRYSAALGEVTLPRNHRATPEVARFGAGLRAIIGRRLSASRKLELVRERIGELPEAPGTLGTDWEAPAAGTTAILTRTNGEAIRVAQRLSGDGDGPPALSFSLRTAGRTAPPPAWIAGLLGPARSPSVTRSQFDRIHAHCRKSMDTETVEAIGLPDADTAWTRLARASGSDPASALFDLAALRRQLDWPDAFPDDQGVPDDVVVITTVHQSKGLEFDNVVLLDPREDNPDRPQDHPDEEALVGFVAVTRAARTLHRLPANSIWPPPTVRSFPHHRERRCRWWNKWVHLETGLPGDIEPESFVDPAIHGSDEAVSSLQQFLLAGAGRLRGHRVLLLKVPVSENRAAYDIHLQEDGQPARLLGRAGQQLVTDLLYLLWKPGYSLPGRIMNLRISGVRTITSPGDDATRIADPFRASRLWLGVELAGTGDFMPYRRKAKT